MSEEEKTKEELLEGVVEDIKIIKNKLEDNEEDYTYYEEDCLLDQISEAFLNYAVLFTSVYVGLKLIGLMKK